MKEIINPYGFIYITTNLINGKRYIGQKMFRKDWKYYLGSGKGIKYAIKKYGRENFQRDIVAIAYSEKELDELEVEWINNYNAIKSYDFYNIAEGGNGNSLAGKTECEIKTIKEEMSRRVAGENNPMYGKTGTLNPVSKSVICINTNEIFDTLTSASEKYNLDISSLTKCCNGKANSCGKSKNGIKLAWGYYDNYLDMTKEEINKILLKSKQGVKGKNNPRARKVICLDDKKIFSTVIETGEYYNISVDGVRRVCKGKYKQMKGKTFKYYDEYLKSKEFALAK